MPNILSVPSSGSIYFSSGISGSPTIPSLASGVALRYDSGAGLNVTSYSTGFVDRFSVDGSAGRLFYISDSLTGVIFSVNDAAGLPIIEVNSTTGDVITMGTYGQNTLVVSGNNVGVGVKNPAYKLDVSGQIHSVGAIFTDDASTTRTNLGLGATNDVQFNSLSLSSGLSVSGASNLSTLSASGIASFSNGINVFNAITHSGNSGGNGWGIVGGGGGGQAGLRNEGGSWGFFGQYFRLGRDRSLSWGQDNNYGDTQDLYLYRDSAGILAQRNSTNAQAFRLYRSYTSSSVYQRLTLNTAASGFNIAAESTSVSDVDLNLLPQGSGKTKTTALEATTDVQVVGGNYEVDFSSLYGSALQLRVNETLVTPVTGSFATASRIIPSGALVLGTVIRVVNGISGDIGTSFSIGDGIDTDKWGNGISFASGTTTNGTNFNTLLPSMYPTGSDVILTPDSGTFTTGQVRVAVHYMSFTAPTL